MASLGLTIASDRINASTVRETAVAMALVEAERSLFHMGCYYRDAETRTVFLLDFPRSGKVRRADPRPEYVWAKSRLSEVDQRAVANMCSAVYERHKLGGPNFALQFVTGFLPDGSLSTTGLGTGFTCATFVMAIYQAANIRLLDIETWESRDSDNDWQFFIYELYTAKKWASPEVTAQIRKDIGCVRFRPQEVLGAATMKNIPVRFKKVLPIAEQIRIFVRNLGRPLQGDGDEKIPPTTEIQ